MKAQILTKHGSLDSYEYTTVPKPTLENEYAIVKVLRCSINNTDIWTREGAYSKDNSSGWQSLNFPIIQGADVCGIVEEINDKKLQGKLVLVNPTIYPLEKLEDDIQNITHCKYLGSEINGGYWLGLVSRLWCPARRRRRGGPPPARTARLKTVKV